MSINHFCYLNQFYLFEEIPDEELKKRAKKIHGQKFKKGEILYSPHQESKNIYVLEHGEIMLYQSHDGKRETFDLIGPGTLFGNFNAANDVPSHFAEATRDSEACVFSREEFIGFLKQNSELMLKFIQSMAERIQDYERRFKNNLQSAKETIYDELHRLREKRKKGFFGKIFGEAGAPLRLTHEQIAEMTGLNRVTVTRSLKELREEEKISIDSNTGIINIIE